MIDNGDTPAKISDRVVDTLFASMALRFKSITTESATSYEAVARAHEDRISSMAEMIRASIVSSGWSFRVGCWWSRKTEPRGSQCFSGSFEGDCWYPKGHTQKATDGTSKRMTGKPDVRVRIQLRHIGV